MNKKSQLFCKKIPKDILYNLIDNVTNINNPDYSISGQLDKYYKIDKIIFKKLEFHNLIKKFLNEIKEYYFYNKQYYIDRNINYNNFLTIVRQICKYNNINLKKKITYEKDTYNIEYYIYIYKI